MKDTRHPLRLLSGALATAVLAGAVFPAIPATPYNAYAAEEIPGENDFDEEFSVQKPQYEVTLHNVIYTGMDIYPDIRRDDIPPNTVFEADAVYLSFYGSFGYGDYDSAIEINPGLCFDGNAYVYRQDAYSLFCEFDKNNILDVTFITDKDYSDYTDEHEILDDLREVAAVKCVKIPGSHFVGDINDDGGIDTYDLLFFREALTNGVDDTLNEDQKKNAEITGDGKVDEADLNELSSYLLGASEGFNAPSAIGSVRLDNTVSAIRSDGKKPTEKFTASQINLGFRLLQELSKNETTKKDKMLISPLSAAAALSMTANGADTKTLEEMEQVLGNGLSIDELNEYFSWFMQNLPNEKKSKVEIANSIWFRDCEWFEVYDSFLEKNKQYFDSEIYKSPYDATTVQDINSWVNQKTKGMIPQLIDDPNAFADPLSCMTLINTLFFEADWVNPYKDSSDTNFTNAAGVKKTVEGLWAGSDNYYELDNALAFKKPYVGGYKFVGILPDEGISLDEYIASIDPEKLASQLSTPGDMDNTVVSTMIPKFSYDYDCSLKEALKALGMKSQWNYNTADFTKIGKINIPDYALYIDDVIQKTNIELTEKGTKAAAATAVMMMAGAGIDPNPPRYINIYLNRPFVYMIVDSNDIPAFIGCVYDLGK